MTSPYPQQPTAAYPQMPIHPAPGPRRRTGLVAVLAILIPLLLASGVVGVMYLNNVGPLKDSGLQMCETMRDARNSGGNGNVVNGNGSKKMSEEQYREFRGKFADSRYSDIRDAGTKFMDLAWQLNGLGDGTGLGAALALAGQIFQTYSSLSGACTAHGVVIPPLTQGRG